MRSIGVVSMTLCFTPTTQDLRGGQMTTITQNGSNWLASVQFPSAPQRTTDFQEMAVAEFVTRIAMW